MEIKRIGEVMIPIDKYPHVNDSCTLCEAIKIMEQSALSMFGRKSLPRVLLVFDADEKLEGILRRRDILRGLEPHFLVSKPLEYRKKLFDVKIDPNLSELSFDKVIKGIKENANRTVKEVMQPIIMTVDYDDRIMKAIYEMVDNNLSLLPVLKNDEVVGVVRSVELLREAADLLFSEEED